MSVLVERTFCDPVGGVQAPPGVNPKSRRRAGRGALGDNRLRNADRTDAAMLATAVMRHCCERREQGRAVDQRLASLAEPGIDLKAAG